MLWKAEESKTDELEELSVEMKLEIAEKAETVNSFKWCIKFMLSGDSKYCHLILVDVTNWKTCICILNTYSIKLFISIQSSFGLHHLCKTTINFALLPSQIP